MYEIQVIMLALKRYARFLTNGVPCSLHEFAEIIEPHGASSEILSVLRNFRSMDVQNAA